MPKRILTKKVRGRNRKRSKLKRTLLGTNAKRAEWAKIGLDAFTTISGSSGELQTDIGDLICDLFHLAYQEGLSVEAVIAHAQFHYKCETVSCRKCKGIFEEFEGDVDKKICASCLEESSK